MIVAEEQVKILGLEPHPEGGFYKRTYLSDDASFSSILFLLTSGNFSAFHRIGSDEQWNFFKGDDVIIHEIDHKGNYKKTILPGVTEQKTYQYIVQAGNWFASECNGDEGYALCGCTVIPAFDFDKFELAKRKELITIFPEHEHLITRLTRNPE